MLRGLLCFLVARSIHFPFVLARVARHQARPCSICLIVTWYLITLYSVQQPPPSDPTPWPAWPAAVVTLARECRDSSYRSAPVSPRHTPSYSWTGSAGSPVKSVASNPFFATAQSVDHVDQVVSAPDVQQRQQRQQQEGMNEGGGGNRGLAHLRNVCQDPDSSHQPKVRGGYGRGGEGGEGCGGMRVLFLFASFRTYL